MIQIYFCVESLLAILRAHSVQPERWTVQHGLTCEEISILWLALHTFLHHSVSRIFWRLQEP